MVRDASPKSKQVSEISFPREGPLAAGDVGLPFTELRRKGSAAYYVSRALLRLYKAPPDAGGACLTVKGRLQGPIHSPANVTAQE
jgi:hypothetical protein